MRQPFVWLGIAIAIIVGALLVSGPRSIGGQGDSVPPPYGTDGTGELSGRIDGTGSTSVQDEVTGQNLTTLVVTLAWSPGWNTKSTDFIVTPDTQLVVGGAVQDLTPGVKWGTIGRADTSQASISYEESATAERAATAEDGYPMPVARRIEIGRVSE